MRSLHRSDAHTSQLSDTVTITVMTLQRLMTGDRARGVGLSVPAFPLCFHVSSVLDDTKFHTGELEIPVAHSQHARRHRHRRPRHPDTE